MLRSEDLEGIKRLKYRYLRCLDTKDWKGLGETLTPDAVSSYDSGRYGFTGRDEIVSFLEKALGNPAIITLHQVHHPEIEFTGDAEATATWYLEDCVIAIEANTELRGTAFYRDEYAKVDGAWKIRSTGYQRVFEETWNRGDAPSLRITKSMFATLDEGSR